MIDQPRSQFRVCLHPGTWCFHSTTNVTRHHNFRKRRHQYWGAYPHQLLSAAPIEVQTEETSSI
jgi:hypothetical protein